MAVIYFSFQNEDRHIATRLVPLLQERGHRVRADWELPIGAAWRDQLMGDLLSSDAVVVIWSANTWKSQFVPAEIGVVRASPQLHLLPVLVGDIEIPPFIRDLLVDRITDTETATLEALAARLDGHVHVRAPLRLVDRASSRSQSSLSSHPHLVGMRSLALRLGLPLGRLQGQLRQSELQGLALDAARRKREDLGHRGLHLQSQ